MVSWLQPSVPDLPQKPVCHTKILFLNHHHEDIPAISWGRSYTE
jgi:hypothetical protein